MQKEFYLYYLDPTLIRGQKITILLETGYVYWQRNETERDESDIDPLTCFNTDVMMHSVEWLPQQNEAPPPIDVPHRVGIQALCQNMNFNVTSSNMADNPVYLFSVTNLNIYIYDTIFEGFEQGSPTQGGLKVNSFSFPKITIENCIFNDLKYNDIAFAQMAALLLSPAAVSLNIESFSIPWYARSLNIKPVKPNGHHVNIINTTFSNNVRAIGVTSDFRTADDFKLLITETKFLNNQAVNDGGAIYLNNGKNVSVDIKNSEFISNKAGVNPFDVDLSAVGVTISTYRPSVKAYGYKFLPDSILELDLEFFVALSGEFQNKSVFLSLRGHGGAISIKYANKFSIRKCQFTNNTASTFGGTIYAGNNANLDIHETSFISGEIPSTLTAGAIIHSYSTFLFLNDSSFRLLETPPELVSAFFHSGEDIKYSVRVQNIALNCPVNSQLRLQNTTNDVKQVEQNIDAPSEGLFFNELIYECELCRSGYYAFGAGLITHSHERVIDRYKRSLDNGTSDAVTLATLFAPPPPPPLPPPPPVPSLPGYTSTIVHHITYVHVICHECPYGGVCKRGIRAKAHNWGLETEGIVTFYKCPSGYCCLETECDTYNRCGNHRYGTLCSTCVPDFSEALFSTTCLPDEKCNQYWFIPVTVVMVLLYAMFLMYQNDLKDFLLGAPIGKRTFKRTITKWVKLKKVGKPDQQPRIIQVTEAMVSERGYNYCNYM